MPRRSLTKSGVAQEWLTPQRTAATSDFYRAMQEDVIAWWRVNQRTDLPWRSKAPATAAPSIDGGASSSYSSATRTPLYNPYEVWVSEVMSQQTRMETVIPYFKRWMDKFPTIEVLAASSEDDVKAVWAGMGYYRRALYMHKGAQYILERHHQQPGDGSSCTPGAKASMPSTQQELLKVPGIGPYTSAAVASLCFGEAVCSVDGNVIRVLSRLRGERNFDPKVPANVKRANAWGQELMGNTTQTSAVVCRDPSALNQGLMEIGASVCRPAGAPLCVACPLQTHCRASALLQSGEIDAIENVIPVRAAVAVRRSAKELCVVHEVAGNETVAGASPRRFTVLRRPPTGLLAGMLEFPTVSAPLQDDDNEADNAAALHEHPLCVLPLLQGRGSTPLYVRACGRIRHIFSHIDMKVEVLHVQWPVNVNARQLLDAVASVLDDFRAYGEPNASPAATRISLMSETELQRGAPSRLTLKVLHHVSSSAVKREPCTPLRIAKRQSGSSTTKVPKKRVKR